jgi:hypothetical protein
MIVDKERFGIRPENSCARNVRKAMGKFCLWIALVMSWWAVSTTGFMAFAEKDSTEGFQEYEVKAAFLYNFGKFVEWPKGSFADDQSPFVLGVLGKDPFGKALDSLKGRGIQGRDFVVKKFDGHETLERCHILFVAESEQAHLTEILKKVKHWPVLTVSDMKGFCPAGGDIALFIEEKSIRFEINVDSAQRKGLKLSSQLLKLAKIYKED